MRRFLAVISALLVSQVSAGFVKGACPTVNSIAYNKNMTNVLSHYLLYLDKSVYSYLGVAEKVAPAGTLPNLTCYNVGNFGYSQVTYNQEFNTNNLLSLKELYFDSTTGTQVGYDCIDSNKAAQLITFVEQQFNFTIPAATVKSFTKLLSAGHFDVFFVLSNQTVISPAVQTSITKAMDAQFLKWQFSSMYAFNMTGC